MGQIFKTQVKENVAIALIDGDIKYIESNFKEEIAKLNFKDLYVFSPYQGIDTTDVLEPATAHSGFVNILEKVVYEAKYDNFEIWKIIFENGADANLIATFKQGPVNEVEWILENMIIEKEVY